MLRNAVIAAGVLLITAAVFIFASGAPTPFGVPALVLGLILALCGIYEHRGYKPIMDQLPPGHWQDTGERFIDPTSKRTVAVYSDPKTGQRIYVATPLR